MEIAVSTKFDSKEWFNSRNLLELEYQTDIIDNKIPYSLNNNKFPTVLAACPSAGKTIMSICFIEKYLIENEGARVLVLTHGTTVLRSQYAEEVEKMRPGFTWKNVESGYELNLAYQVNITIPQTIIREEIPKFDLIIVDEAHHYYFANMIKKILAESKPKHQILLTGTPSVFIGFGYSIIPIAVNKLLDLDMVSDLNVELASSTYNFNSKDYNSDFELKNNVIIRNEATVSTLDLLLDKVLSRLKSIFRDDPVKYAALNNSVGWAIALKSLQKTMVACNSQEQAKQVYDYFSLKGIDCALSITDTDSTSYEINRFKKEKDCLILIVVNRGVLGFNFPEMENVIDMTASQNIDRIFQLMCRVIRKHPNGKKKLFFKIAPYYLAEYFEFLMSFVLCLTDEEYYLKFNGKNLMDLEVPVIKEKRINDIPNPSKYISGLNSNYTEDPKIKREIKVIDYVGLPSIRLFKDILHKNHDILTSYAYVRIGEIRNILIREKISHEYLMGLSEEDFIDYVKGKIKDRNIKDYSGLYSISSIINVVLKKKWRKKICDSMGWNFYVPFKYSDYVGTDDELLNEIEKHIVEGKIFNFTNLCTYFKKHNLRPYIHQIGFRNLTTKVIERIQKSIKIYPVEVLIEDILEMIRIKGVLNHEQYIRRRSPATKELYERGLEHMIVTKKNWKPCRDTKKKEVLIYEYNTQENLIEKLAMYNTDLFFTNDQIEKN